MDLKKKLKRFFTLTRKANDGFTLVELIVVIAILAILAGVGSVGYAGYIKSANKGADKTLVGNVMRAIETGTNSYAFVNDDSFKLAKMSYPVGFVVLTENGAKIVTSETEKVPGVAGECEFETINNVVSLNNVGGAICSSIWWKDWFTCSSNTITYCKTHSSDPVIVSLDGQTYISGYNHTSHGTLSRCGGATAINTPYPAGAKTVSNADSLYTLKSDGKCEYAYANQNATFRSETKIVENTTSGELYDSLTAAFGPDLSALKLKYNGWTTDEGVDFATFYLSAPELMEDIEDLSGLLAIGSKLSVEELGLRQRYENGEEVLSGVSAGIAGTHSEATWMNEWRAAGNAGWSDNDFGLTYREEYSAARMAYNNAFASYITATDKTIDSKYVGLIKEFYSQELLGVGLPGTVCTSAFTSSDSPLKQKFIDAGDATAGQEGSAFNKCAALFETYKTSPACEENGKLVYNTMATFNETADVANAYSDLNGGSIYDYYNNYVNEINALYEAAQTAAGEGIVIVVTVENGLLNFNVSPNAANPRLD